MNKFLFLVKLSEKDWRLIIAIFLIFVLIFLIFSLIFDVVRQVMRRQGRRVDADMKMLVEANLIRSPKDFSRNAHRKSNVVLFYQLFPPILIALCTTVIYVIVMLFMGPINLFDYKTEGISTLFYIFDWANQPRANFFGINLPSDWPEVISTPHFAPRAIISYMVVPLYFISLLWGILAIQSYLSRFIRILVLKRKLFSADLDDKRLLDLSALEPESVEEEPKKEEIDVLSP